MPGKNDSDNDSSYPTSPEPLVNIGTNVNIGTTIQDAFNPEGRAAKV